MNCQQHCCENVIMWCHKEFCKGKGMSLHKCAAEKILTLKVLQNQTWKHTCMSQMFPEFFNFLSDYSSACKTDKLCWLLMTSKTDYVTMEGELWIVNWQYREQYGPFIMIITAFHWGTQENHGKPVGASADINQRVFAPLTLQWCWGWNTNCCPQQRSSKCKVPHNTLTL